MKKFLAALLLVIMVVGTVGCNDDTRLNDRNEKVTDRDDKEEKKRGLIKINKLEEKLNEIYRELYSEYEGITEFEIEDVDEDTYDQTFRAIIFPSRGDNTGIIITGFIKDGYVIELQSRGLGLFNFDQIDEDSKTVASSFCAAPIGLFKRKVDTFEKIQDFISDMSVCGEYGDGGTKLQAISGDIEYTVMSNHYEDDISFMLTIRYLPAFPGGFFEDDTKAETDVKVETDADTQTGTDVETDAAESDTAFESDTAEPDDEFSLSQFNAMAEGIWVDMENAYIETDFCVFDFFVFKDGEYCSGRYPGEYDRSAKIIGVEKNGNFYTLELYYPAEERYGEWLEEDYYEVEIELTGHKLSFVGYDYVYTFKGFTLDEAITAVLQPEEKSAAEEIVANTMPIIDFDTMIVTRLKNLPYINDSYAGSPARFAEVDLDGDGEDEILIEYSARGDTAVLHRDGDYYYAYYMPYRGISGLKTDGTSSWSNSAFESGVQRLSFSDEGIVSVYTVVYNTQDNIFTVDGISVSEEKCSSALSEQYAKEDVEWQWIE